VRFVLGRAETAAAMGYSAGHGVIVRVEQVWIEPVAAKPGDRLTLRARVVALAPREDSTVGVREVWSVLFAGLPLTSLPARDLTLRQGTSDIESTFTLPPDAADGEYAVELVVRLVGTADLRESKGASPFAVVAERAPPRDRPSPPTPPPARMVRIKIESVDVRSGPTASSRARARIPRDSAVEVLEDRQLGRERWYRVRLANGDEGWIPATAATAPE
jgi:Bacterial SH3 domain